MNNVDPDGRAIVIAGVAIGAVATFLAAQASFAAAETAVEYAAINALGSQEDLENFSIIATFGKNFGINVVTFGVGGKVKAFRNLGRLGQFALRQGIEIGGDTAFDVGFNGRGVAESLITNTAGSLIGEGAARGIAAGARAFHRNFEVVVDRSSVTLGANLSDPGIRIRRRVDAPNTSLKNRSGNLAETAQKARTQPHLGRPTPPAPKAEKGDILLFESQTTQKAQPA